MQSTFSPKLQYHHQSVCRVRLFFSAGCGPMCCLIASVFFFGFVQIRHSRKLTVSICHLSKCFVVCFLLFRIFKLRLLCILCVYVHHLPGLNWLNSRRPASSPLRGISTRTKLTSRLGSQRISEWKIYSGRLEQSGCDKREWLRTSAVIEAAVRTDGRTWHSLRVWTISPPSLHKCTLLHSCKSGKTLT